MGGDGRGRCDGGAGVGGWDEDGRAGLGVIVAREAQSDGGVFARDSVERGGNGVGAAGLGEGGAGDAERDRRLRIAVDRKSVGQGKRGERGGRRVAEKKRARGV